MSALLMGLLTSVLPGVLDRVLPEDPQKAAEAKLKVLELMQTGEFKELDANLQVALAQLEVNKEEAKTDNFRGGWRPSVGWVCVFGLAYQFILMPLLPWVVALFGKTVPPLPAIDNDTLMVLLTGMLGLGGMRTFERIKGKA